MKKIVIPAKAGIQEKQMDSRLRGNGRIENPEVEPQDFLSILILIFYTISTAPSLRTCISSPVILTKVDGAEMSSPSST